MSNGVHGGAHGLPVPLELAVPIVAVGLVVFLAIAYDLYHNDLPI